MKSILLKTDVDVSIDKDAIVRKIKKDIQEDLAKIFSEEYMTRYENHISRMVDTRIDEYNYEWLDKRIDEAIRHRLIQRVGNIYYDSVEFIPEESTTEMAIELGMQAKVTSELIQDKTIQDRIINKAAYFLANMVKQRSRGFKKVLEKVEQEIGEESK